MILVRIGLETIVGKPFSNHVTTLFSILDYQIRTRWRQIGNCVVIAAIIDILLNVEQHIIYKY